MHDAEHVAVVVARFVRVVQPVAGLQDHAGDDARVDQLAALGELGEHPRQRHAVEVFHGDEPGVVHMAEREHATDVGVDQHRREVGLIAKHGDEVLVFRQVREDALDH